VNGPARRRFVVDADVARASGKGRPPAPACLDVLETLLRVCHRLALPQLLADEWNRHASRQGRRWLKQMQNRRKVDKLELRRIDEIRGRLASLARGPADERAMIKDAHLVATAVEYRARVLSLNDADRDRFRAAAQQFGDLGLVLWANPSREEEKVGAWLEGGAPDEALRRLMVPAGNT
jgi:predicted nucleic acid-binding protein